MSSNSELQKIRVIIADDHPIIWDGLITALARDPRVEVVAAVASFQELSESLCNHIVDVVLLDLMGMGKAFIPLVERLTQKFPHQAIVVFSSKTDMVPEMLKAGARGYVTKQELSHCILGAVKAVAAGGQFLSPIAQTYLARATAQGENFHLRPREVSVLKLMSDGLITKQIADELGIQKGVVDNYVTSLKKKTRCTTRMELIDWYRHAYMEEP